jgi:hypothetical protein
MNFRIGVKVYVWVAIAYVSFDELITEQFYIIEASKLMYTVPFPIIWFV